MDTAPLVVLLLFSWIPILSLTHMVKTLRGGGGGKSGKVNNKHLDAMQAELDHLRTEMDQLRNTSTGFDLSFDKRLSELELQARLARLKDIDANHGQQQSHHR
jgi:hypothetical protein